MKHGIDLSHWNNLSDIWNPQAQPVDFLFAKLTEGATYKDFTAYTYWLYAKNMGIEYGCYHFARPRQNVSRGGALAEARNFLESYRLFKNPTIQVILDYEEFLDDEALDDAYAFLWLQEVAKETVNKPLLYCSQSRTKRFKKTNEIADLWVARYNNYIGDVTPWKQALIWQYTSKGIDKNILIEKGETHETAKQYKEKKGQ